MSEKVKMIGISLIVGALLGIAGTSFYDREAIFSLEACEQKVEGLGYASEFVHYGDSEYSDIYLNGFQALYNSSWDEAFKENPRLYKFWSGFKSPEHHRKYLEDRSPKHTILPI